MTSTSGCCKRSASRAIGRNGSASDFDGVLSTANAAVETAKAALRLFDEDRKKIQEIGRGAGSALRVHQELQRQPLLNVKEAVQRTGLSDPTAGAALARLIDIGIVREVTGRERGRIFSYQRYVRVLVFWTKEQSHYEPSALGPSQIRSGGFRGTGADVYRAPCRW